MDSHSQTSGKGKPVILAVAALAGLVLMFIAFWVMWPIDAQLKNATAGSVPGGGLFAWELAFSAYRAQALVDVWAGNLGSDWQSVAASAIWIDFLLIAGYVLAMTALCFLAVPFFDGREWTWTNTSWRAFLGLPFNRGRLASKFNEKKITRLDITWGDVTQLPLAAGIMDVTENILLLLQLNGHVQDLARWAGSAALLKFLFLTVAVTALLILGAVLLCYWLSRQRVFHSDQLEVVLAKVRRNLSPRASLGEVLEEVRRLSPPPVMLQKVLEDALKQFPDETRIDKVLEAIRPLLPRAVRLEDVLREETDYIDSRRKKVGILKKLREGDQPIGLACSGGGIRSATVNLGVLQTLARRRALPKIDYLSSVSGGGYIGAALSSLLSINKDRFHYSPRGERQQYDFAQSREARFSTNEDQFPFIPKTETDPDDRNYGDIELKHLRASGEFLVPRRRLFSVELLRTLGGLVGGFVLHLLHVGLMLLCVAAGYLWVIHLMIGKLASSDGDPIRQCSLGRPPCPDSATADPSAIYVAYVKEALGFNYFNGPAPNIWFSEFLTHPFTIAAIIGLVLALTTIWLNRHLLDALPSRHFARPGMSIEQSRHFVSVVALVVIILLAAIGTTAAFIVVQERQRLLNISIPLALYFGAALVLLIRHAMLVSGSEFNRVKRGQLGAREGAFVYVVAISLALVLLILPFLVFFDSLTKTIADRPVGSVTGWLLTVLGARIVAGGEGQSGRAAGKTGFLNRLFSMFPSLRKFLYNVILAVAILGALLLICVWIWNINPNETGHRMIRAQFFFGALGVLLLLNIAHLFDLRVFRAWLRHRGWMSSLGHDGWLIRRLNLNSLLGWLNLNKASLHYFYRDRLAEAYLRTLKPAFDGTMETQRDNESMALTDLHGRAGKDYAACVTSAPYHLLVTCLNLTAGRDPQKRSRKCDQFLFSKLYCGSETTGFQRTSDYRDGRTKLARAMTISGAAANPAMGARTFFAQSAAMTLLNVRLGQWMENPGFDGGTKTHRRESGVVWSWYLLKEMFAYTHARSRLVYLSDGGHAGDNLGIRPLLARRCRLIIAVDAEYDPDLTFNSLIEALRQSEIDDGVKVDIDLSPLQPSGQSGLSLQHWIVGDITYPARPGHSRSHGKLVVLKSSLTGDEDPQIENYKLNNPDFPHQTTGDQFFDEAQFEAYRQLGVHMAESLFRELRDVSKEYGDLCKELRSEPTGRSSPASPSGGTASPVT